MRLSHQDISYLEKILAIKLPTAQMRANPHIESRVKLLKRQYNALFEILNIGSEFSWNEEEKYLTASKDVLMIGLGVIQLLLD
ncbi:hypothetical protein HRI_003996200 [Hibiscus trionum]|uniref:Myb/SANT-like domain-containing protein n=1 Tax=Hibiscus trionum TaxID=183268 RepID=A0A9W7IWL2_HIBTR|nr:hypothetical protein HRI_003996200 [Hibiscus trionum]